MIVNLIASILKVNHAVITKYGDEIKEIVSNIDDSEDNSSDNKDIYKIAEHYCQKVIKEEEEIIINNKLNKDNKEINQSQEKIVSYLGLPNS